MSLTWEGANFGFFSRHHVRAARKVAELFAFGDDFSSNLFTHSNEAELEFQSERAYRAVELLILWRAAADDDGQYCFAVALCCGANVSSIRRWLNEAEQKFTMRCRGGLPARIQSATSNTIVAVEGIFTLGLSESTRAKPILDGPRGRVLRGGRRE